MSQPEGDANPDQYAPLDQVEQPVQRAGVPSASSYYNTIDFMCNPCYAKNGSNSCLYTAAVSGRYDPRDLPPQIVGAPFVPCQPSKGVITNCYFPEMGEHTTDACNDLMFEKGLATSMARRGGSAYNATPASLQALASLAEQRRRACPNYLCKNDESYSGSNDRKSFASSSCSCVSEPVASSLSRAALKKRGKK